MRNIADIRAALEIALTTVYPSVSTSWENISYTPVEGVPYQKANLLLATPVNSEFGENYLEQGIFQVTLLYPLLQGTADAVARAMLLREKFKRGSTFSSGDEVVVIQRTPEIAEGRVDGDRWAIPVKIRWQA